MTEKTHNSESGELEERLVRINRSAATIKGGRRFSFSSLVVVGDGTGRFGLGTGKASLVANAISKGSKQARKHLHTIPLAGDTIPFQVEGRTGKSVVRLIPASAGTGVIAGATVRAVLEIVGIKDILTKVYGSTNPLNVLKATEHALLQLRSQEQMEDLRGVKLDIIKK